MREDPELDNVHISLWKEFFVPEWILRQVNKQCDDEEHSGDDVEHRVCLCLEVPAPVIYVKRFAILTNTIIAAIES